MKVYNTSPPWRRQLSGLTTSIKDLILLKWLSLPLALPQGPKASCAWEMIPLPLDDSIETYARTRKEPYKKIKYNENFVPPESTVTPESKGSDRLKGRPPTLWSTSGNAKTLLLNTPTLNVLPSSSQLEPYKGLKETFPHKAKQLALSVEDKDKRLMLTMEG